MPSPRDHSLLVRAATLYYLEGRSQAEVAAEIGVSRSNVSRVLAAAREQGIVDIRINDPVVRATELEQQLITRYGLQDCRVTPGDPNENPLAKVGGAGAKWLMENLPDEGAISLSWGSSVQAVIDAVPSNGRHASLEILPLVGGLSIVDSAHDGNVLVRSLAIKLGARHRRLHAPAVVGSEHTRDALLREASISSVLAAASNSQIAIVGVGRVGRGASSSILDSMKLSPKEMRHFQNSGAVGDCCTRYFDHAGIAVESIANDRVISIDLSDLRKIPRIVGVAIGAEKAIAVHSAVLGKLLNNLVIDDSLARALLDLPDS